MGTVENVADLWPIVRKKSLKIREDLFVPSPTHNVNKIKQLALAASFIERLANCLILITYSFYSLVKFDQETFPQNSILRQVVEFIR
jgi:hypothetical protein